jgi:hypothetical protein
MMRLARKRWIWGMVAGVAVMVLLSVLDIIPLAFSQGITSGGIMLAAMGLVIGLPLAMVVLLTRILRRRRRHSPMRLSSQTAQTEIGVEPLTRLAADRPRPGAGH